MEALTPELNPILHVPTDSLGNQHHDAVSSALAAYFEEEDSRQHLLETKAENRL
jgi:mannitol/fructose-specific phosphotransferase system IIA component (Ntr-type)